MIHDHYEVLGVGADADQSDVRAAYLQVMRRHHPDHVPEDPASEDKVRAANAAWEVLGDRDRRAAYDQLREVRAARSEPAAPRAGRRPSHPRVVVPAYSDERLQFQRQFSRALLRFASAAFAVGTVLLLLSA